MNPNSRKMNWEKEFIESITEALRADARLIVDEGVHIVYDLGRGTVRFSVDESFIQNAQAEAVREFAEKVRGLISSDAISSIPTGADENYLDGYSTGFYSALDQVLDSLAEEEKE